MRIIYVNKKYCFYSYNLVEKIIWKNTLRYFPQFFGGFSNATFTFFIFHIFWIILLLDLHFSSFESFYYWILHFHIFCFVELLDSFSPSEFPSLKWIESGECHRFYRLITVFPPPLWDNLGAPLWPPLIHMLACTLHRLDDRDTWCRHLS